MQTAGTAAAVTGRRELDADDKVLEFMLNALRLAQGFAPALFTARTGLPLDCIGDQLQQAQEQRLLQVADGLIRPTPRGTQFLNNLLELF